MHFYFAWVADGTTTFGVEHQVNDEDVFGFEIEHLENDSPTLSIEIINPRVGLLNADRDQWMWLSVRMPDLSVIPLFHGRLIGIPEAIDRETVVLEFTARPADYDAQKRALAETLKVIPYWDPIWIDDTKLDDPDVVLEARSQLWHVGRTDKTVSVSDILDGEDGTLEFDGDDVFEESVDISYGDQPISKVNVTASVEWEQAATGEVDFTALLVKEFAQHGSSPPNISSYTGDGLESTWPLYGTSMGGGWMVGESRVVLLSGDAITASYTVVDIDPNKATPDIEPEEWWEDSPQGFDYWYDKAVADWIADAMTNTPPEARFYLWVFKPTFYARYEARRNRKETATFSVEADVQKLVADTDANVLELNLSSNSLVEPIDPDDARPIGDVRNRTFFDTARGDQAVQYLLSYVRAHMLSSARAVNVSFEVPFELGLDLSCRHDVILNHEDLPSGQAVGKVIAYKLSSADNENRCYITIGCAIGQGNTLPVPETGDPVYAVEGYVATGYQHYEGSEYQPIVGEISYKDFVVPTVDDGIDFKTMKPLDLIHDLQASGLLTFTGPGVLNETVNIGARAYTLKNALTGADQVLIGDDGEETARNLAAAINGDEDQIGTTFGTGTVAHAQVSAEASAGILRATARAGGAAGNSITTTTTIGDASWEEATLTGGGDGLQVINGPDDQESVLGATFGSPQEAIDELNANYTRVRVSLKPVVGGPYEAEFEIEVSDLMVPKMIDLEAAAV